MRRRIVLSLSVLFALFTLGAGFSMYYINSTANRLESLIRLHRVEIMRQHLIFSAQRVQAELYTVDTVFRAELDTIVKDVQTLDQAVRSCRNCHHAPEIRRRLDEIPPLVEDYKKLLSFALTASANKARIQKIKMMASEIGDRILSKTREMTIIAAQKLHQRTSHAVREIKNSRNILVITLIGAFCMALLTAISLTRGITRPVEELLAFARRLTAGQFDRPPSVEAKNEFGELATALDKMRLALLESNQRVYAFIRKLSGLYETTLSIHAGPETAPEQLFADLPSEVVGLLNVEIFGLLLEDPRTGQLRYTSPPIGLSAEEQERTVFGPQQARLFFECAPEGTFIENRPVESSILREFRPLDLERRNVLYSWIHRPGRIMGVFYAANKKNDTFREEDAQLLSILASHMAVAIENRSLYDDLKAQMIELREAQEQLVQSSKLAAIGELASNVAHEINNPLTSILGYTELLKDEEDLEAIRSDLEVIEQESIRARTIVKQLLEFSRRRPLDVQRADVNRILQEVIPLVNTMAKASRVKIATNYGELPLVEVDTNQMKQVFINLMNNAIHAMKEGGVLSIRTRREADGIAIVFKDTGEGIPKEILSRIFEPFFSTKKDKGTGLGLSISYSIVQNHGGRLSVESQPGVGTTFTVFLSLDRPAVEAPDSPDAPQRA